MRDIPSDSGLPKVIMIEVPAPEKTCFIITPFKDELDSLSRIIEDAANQSDLKYDAAFFYREKAERRSRILETLGLESKGYILATIHRQENTDDRQQMSNIVVGFAESPYPIIWPLHPRSRKRLAELGLVLPATVRAIEPVGYLDMIMLEKHARLIATDSGGVQKEAYFHQVPCGTLREETEWVEWVELVEVGVNRLVGTDGGAISLSLATSSDIGCFDVPLYGKGATGFEIANCLFLPRGCDRKREKYGIKS